MSACPRLRVGDFCIGTADFATVRERLVSGLDLYNSTKSSAPLYEPFRYALSVTDEVGQIRGGLGGEFVWDWLSLELLWVEESLRGRGIGSALVQQAEKDMLDKGGVGIYLWTYSWQAPRFYEKRGFKRFITITDFPRGYQRIGLLKRLT